MTMLNTSVKNIARDVLQSFTDPTEVTPSLAPPNPHDTLMSCEVTISGAFCGKVVVRASRNLVHVVVKHMFSAVEISEPAEQLASEALRELANIVAGNIKPLFGPGNTLGIPREHDDAVAEEAMDSVAKVRLRLVAGVLEVCVLREASDLQSAVT